MTDFQTIFLTAGCVVGFFLALKLAFKFSELMQAGIRLAKTQQDYFEKSTAARQADSEAYQAHLKMQTGFLRRQTEAVEINLADKLKGEG